MANERTERDERGSTLKGKRCVVCDMPANHFENSLAYCGMHDHAALKRQAQSSGDSRGSTPAAQPAIVTQTGVSVSVERYNELIQAELSLKNVYNAIEGLAFCSDPECDSCCCHIHKPAVMTAISKVYFTRDVDMVVWVAENAKAYAALRGVSATGETPQPPATARQMARHFAKEIDDYLGDDIEDSMDTRLDKIVTVLLACSAQLRRLQPVAAESPADPYERVFGIKPQPIASVTDKPPATDPFSKGYKHRNGGPVSDACGDGKHSECAQDFSKCNCTVRGGHATPHAYMNSPVAVASVTDQLHPGTCSKCGAGMTCTSCGQAGRTEAEERAEFEEWARGLWPDADYSREPDGSYVKPDLQLAFEAWLAARGRETR